MALGNTSNKLYLNISEGKIVQRVPAGTPNAESRAKKDGTLIYELRYSFISAVITSISIRESEFSGQVMKDWVFELNDGLSTYQLQIMYDSRYASSLLFALANPVIDFSQEITISPWMKVVADKKKTSCYLSQNGKQIEWYFTKENPNGMPDLKEVIFQGKPRLDSYDRMQFLEKYVETKIKPKLIAAPYSNQPSHPSQPSQSFNPVNQPSNGFEDDDLPF